jgi:large subunit ribosomal protein L21
LYAIIRQGSKQYKIYEGQEINLDHLQGENGESLSLQNQTPVVFFSSDKQKVFSSNDLARIDIKAKIIEHHLADKVNVFKYKPKKGYRRFRGHRQMTTKVMIESISLPKSKARKSVERTKDKELSN